LLFIFAPSVPSIFKPLLLGVAEKISVARVRLLLRRDFAARVNFCR
jgi:hypothetical protein